MAPSTDQALAAAPRRRLLERLRDGAPVDAHTLAGELGLHVTTVRFHLDVLIRAGLVSSSAQPRAGAGRPRLLYTTTGRYENARTDQYPALVSLLAAHLGDSPEARTARAERAGTAWAAELVATSTATQPPTAQEAARAVAGVFDELGFGPELEETDGGQQILLHGCPFRAAARTSPEVVCAVHLGLLRGTLDRLGAPAVRVSLRSFVGPELCVAHLAAGRPEQDMPRRERTGEHHDGQHEDTDARSSARARRRRSHPLLDRSGHP